MLSLIYRPPNSADFYVKLEKQLDGVCRRRKNIMKISDLNANLRSIMGHSEVTYANANGRLITRMNVYVLREFGHVDVITQPTRKTESLKTLIDLSISSMLRHGSYAVQTT